MKKIAKFLLIFLSFTIVFASCDDYDDSFLKGEIEAIKTELESLKKQVTSVKTVVDALEKGKVITSVDKLENDKGYKITFNDATSIEVVNGKDAPVVGVKEFEGLYYWTITTDGNVEFLLDKDNNKLPVSGKDGQTGNDGATPQMSIDAEGYWTVNNARVKDANGDFVKAKPDEAFFRGIKEDDESVTFVLADDSTIVIPKSQGTFLRFESKDENPSFVFKPGQAQKLRIKFANIKSMEVISKPEGWTTNIHVPDKYVNVVAAQQGYGIGEIKLQGIDKNGLIFLAVARVSLAGSGFSAVDGVFILNEGNMTTENGSLIYLTPDGKVLDRVYSTANGRELGNSTQDLFIKDGKMYIISQNGNKNPLGTGFENDGMLIVANAETMKGEASYNNELSTLSWPTHVAVLDEQNVFLRDNNGVHHFNTTSKELNLIDGSRGAKKNTMAVADNKVFASAGNNVLVMEKDKHAVSHTISMGAAVSGVVKSEDGNIWVSTTGKPNKISKVNSKTYEVIKSNDISVGNLAAGVFATPGITAVGEVLYYGGGSFSVYRHDFTTGESKEVLNKATFQSMVPNAKMVYNSMAVHPKTGRVYINTIKGYGWDFLINDISVFNFDGETPVLEANHQNYTHFPAGIFFNANFQ